MNFNNLTTNITDAVTGQAIGLAGNWLFSGVSSGFGSRGSVRFYYDKDAGGGILNVLAKSALDAAMSLISKEAKEAYDKFVGITKLKEKQEMKYGADYVRLVDEGMLAAKNGEYGQMELNGKVIMAKDCGGEVCRDALMLAIPTKDPVTITQTTKYLSGNGNTTEKTTTATINHLVWYDNTALITIQNERNVLLTKVIGRDYSRKELVSNGDIEFSVVGHMSSNLPDVYPTGEIKKFIQIMRYKGVVEVNNQFLDQFGISKILIKGFNLPQKEGFKNVQDYSFTAVGIQPSSEVSVTEDTIKMVNVALTETKKEDAWSDLLKSKVDGLKVMGQDALEQGMSLGAGILNKML